MATNHVLPETVLDGILPEKVANHVSVSPMRIPALRSALLCETFVVCCDMRTALIPIVETSVTEIEATTPSSFGRQTTDRFVGVGTVIATVGLLVMIFELVRPIEDIIARRMRARPL